jgi:hypothetical protein
MNEPTQNPASKDVVPVSVPLPVPTPPGVPARAAAAATEDQLPTSRLPTIAPPLPPRLPPPVPGQKPPGLRPIGREEATAKYTVETKRERWQAAIRHVKRAARTYRFGGGAWTDRRIGVTCAALGLAMIAGSLVLGWESVASEQLEKAEHASLAVAVVLARAAIAIAAMIVGYGLLRIGERTALTTARRDAAADGGASRS